MPGLLPLIAEVLLRLGCRRALVVHGDDGLDELSVSAPTQVCEVRGDTGTLQTYTVTPTELGLFEYPRETVLGGSAQDNAATMRRILAGEQSGALSDMVALNAGAALYVMDRVPDLRGGVELARGDAPDGQSAGDSRRFGCRLALGLSRSSTEGRRAGRTFSKSRYGCESYGRREISRSDCGRDAPESGGEKGAGLAGDPAGRGGESLHHLAASPLPSAPRRWDQPD